ncbi:MAG: GNAT family N-acetyltransferase [Gammaproteobacteria bacterium]|nr:MAG: N-acetyltransferase [Gammaproteobacteria bacterium]UCH41169.1 MAG: GNAT family N-acetyltransferase [Gammaproteobacteria bacterium]
MQPLSLTTSRLRITWLELDDAAFIFRLLNDPDWIRYIGDKSVTSLDDARAYLEGGPLNSYREHGFGLNRIALVDSDEPIGICGILSRESLPCPDLGFALLPEHRQQGYALEAARAVLQHASHYLALRHVAAILSPQNRASANLLRKLGFRYDKRYQQKSDNTELDSYAIDLSAPQAPNMGKINP